MSNLPNFFNRNSLTGNPVRDLLRMQKRMDELFGEMWNPGSQDLQVSPLSGPAFNPSCDVEETETHYLMSFDLPGVKRDDIKIDLTDDVLTVSGERKEEREVKNGQKYQSERFQGAFARSFQIPAGMKPDQVEAHYADGVLRIAVPRTGVAKAEQIKISEGKTGFWDKLLGHGKENAQTTGQANSPTAGQTNGKFSTDSGPRLQVKAG